MTSTLAHQGRDGAQLRVANDTGSNISLEIEQRGQINKVDLDPFAAVQVAHWIINHLDTHDIEAEIKRSKPA